MPNPTMIKKVSFIHIFVFFEIANSNRFSPLIFLLKILINERIFSIGSKNQTDTIFQKNNNAIHSCMLNSWPLQSVESVHRNYSICSCMISITNSMLISHRPNSFEQIKYLMTTVCILGNRGIDRA